VQPSAVDRADSVPRVHGPGHA